MLSIGVSELVGILVALVIAFLAVMIFIYRRFRTLSSLEFVLTPPDMPRFIIVAIKEAELGYYRRQPFWRRWVEAQQDIVTFLSPRLVYRLNFSVGRYRIKPKTIEAIAPWAIEEGYLELPAGASDRLRAFIAYFSHQPSINDWQIAAYLARLKGEHPDLSGMTWDAIAADDQMIAKLYSGYMGAGGDWQGWRTTLEPGAEAKRRFEHDPESGRYRLLDKLRESDP